MNAHIIFVLPILHIEHTGEHDVPAVPATLIFEARHFATVTVFLLTREARGHGHSVPPCPRLQYPKLTVSAHGPAGSGVRLVATSVR